MDAELQRLCEFFELMNKKEGPAINVKKVIADEDVSLENIEKFDEFMRKTGGHTGGWDAPEHAVFIKLLKKSSIRNVIQTLRSRFPDISEEDIIEHEIWYKKYVVLKSKREHTLRYWKMNKLEKEQFEKNKERYEVKVESQQKRDENVKHKIQIWKEEQRKLREEAVQKQEYEQKMKEEREKLRRITSENKKKIITEYKREKESIDAALTAARQVEKMEQKKQRAKLANGMLSKFRKRDGKLIQNTRMKKQSKFLREQQRRELLELIASKSRKHIRATRDPVRLLVPTVGWKQKVKKTNFENITSSPFEDKPVGITNIQHLATPEWMKELMNNPSTTTTDDS